MFSWWPTRSYLSWSLILSHLTSFYILAFSGLIPWTSREYYCSSPLTLLFPRPCMFFPKTTAWLAPLPPSSLYSVKHSLTTSLSLTWSPSEAGPHKGISEQVIYLGDDPLNSRKGMGSWDSEGKEASLECIHEQIASMANWSSCPPRSSRTLNRTHLSVVSCARYSH